MHIISLWLGKITLALLRVFKKRGAALPGLIVETLDKKFMAHMLNGLPDGVVVISGTNGKTTSTKMLAAILAGSGKKVLTNPTGSNFTRGIIASIVAHASWRGKLNYDIAVIELDEAYAARFVKQVRPRVSLLLNVMRDQMDRFGEIDHTAQLLKDVVEQTTELVILNRDDSRIIALADNAICRVELYGVADSLRSIFRNDDELHSEVITNSTKALCELRSFSDGSITVAVDGKKNDFRLSLYGVYNAQNACAVIATCYAMGLDVDTIERLLKDVAPAFGRGERILIDDKRVILQLVKNPGGFRHALLGAITIADDHTLIAINDAYADGRDVSWLWDVDFSSLKGKSLSTTGVRATDMALRLHYDDIAVEDDDDNISTAFKEALLRTPSQGTLHIFTTYTAMLKLRQLMSTITEVEQV
jgi:lipid II isoglutaminyl synthase (glutamine-hydrolysing)